MNSRRPLAYSNRMKCRSRSAFGHDVSYGYCTHISALLQVLPNMYRPPGLTSAVVCPTSRLCSWNSPSEGLQLPAGTPIESMVARKRKYGHIPKDTSKRQREDISKRLREDIYTERNPLNNAHKLDRNSDARKAARAKVCRLVRESFKNIGS